MHSPPSESCNLQKWIDRHKAGDASARDELVNHACARLLRLTRKMLKSYPAVHRWEETDDVFQNAMIRLLSSLKATQPQSTRHFLNLATLQIRRELIDLGRHYSGPQGMGARHDTNRKHPTRDTPETTYEPSRLAQWCEFHQQVQALPGEEREIFDLLWYQEIPQAAAAVLLGISERTLQRRWQTARLKVFQALKGELPE